MMLARIKRAEQEIAQLFQSRQLNAGLDDVCRIYFLYKARSNLLLASLMLCNTFFPSNSHSFIRFRLSSLFSASSIHLFSRHKEKSGATREIIWFFHPLSQSSENKKLSIFNGIRDSVSTPFFFHKISSFVMVEFISLSTHQLVNEFLDAHNKTLSIFLIALSIFV